MIQNCPMCGKAFDVLWPHLWAYKKGSQFLCSWSCLRMSEKGVKEMGGAVKVPEEAKKKAIQAALDGRDPYEYLRPYTGNPKAMWTYIKQMVKKKNPELYAKIPDLRRLDEVRERWKKAIAQVPEEEDRIPSLSDAMAGMQNAADKFFGECEKMGLNVSQAQDPEPAPERKPVNYDGMTVRAVEGDFGTYHYSRQKWNGSDERDYIDYSNREGDELSMTVEQWRKFLIELRHAAEILGVKL